MHVAGIALGNDVVFKGDDLDKTAGNACGLGQKSNGCYGKAIITGAVGACFAGGLLFNGLDYFFIRYYPPPTGGKSPTRSPCCRAVERDPLTPLMNISLTLSLGILSWSVSSPAVAPKGIGYGSEMSGSNFERVAKSFNLISAFMISLMIYKNWFRLYRKSTAVKLKRTGFSRVLIASVPDCVVTKVHTRRGYKNI